MDGVVIYTPDSISNVDPFFPPPGFQNETVDSCLAHCQSAGVYHYHMASGCMLNPPTGIISSCSATSGCSSNIATYSISTFSSYQAKTVIGLATDGHIIYGPYLSSNTPVTSGFDACNGMFHDSIGNYGYFATSTYPYLVGCFGPANYPSFGPNCTTNGVSSYTMSSFASSFLNNPSASSNAPPPPQSSGPTQSRSQSSMAPQTPPPQSSGPTQSRSQSSVPPQTPPPQSSSPSSPPSTSASQASTATTVVTRQPARARSISIRPCLNYFLLLLSMVVCLF